MERGGNGSRESAGLFPPEAVLWILVCKEKSPPPSLFQHMFPFLSSIPHQKQDAPVRSYCKREGAREEKSEVKKKRRIFPTKLFRLFLFPVFFSIL